jgi:cell wall-associated NlpC family hydrolase
MKKKIIVLLLTISILVALAVTAFAATGVVTASWINFRETPSTDSSVINVYRRGTHVEVLAQPNTNWYQVKIGEKIGYMHTKYVDLPPELNFTSGKANITGNGVRLRTGPSLSAGVITYLYTTDTVKALEKSGDWYKVDYNGRVGYVFGKYVKVTVEPLPALAPQPSPDPGQTPAPSPSPDAGQTPAPSPDPGQTPTPSPDPGQTPTPSPDPGQTPTPSPDPGQTPAAGITVGEKIVEDALTYLNYPYKYAGSDENGFDCSGFTYFMFYKKYGFDTFNRTASQQWHNGSPVNKADLKKGDLVFFCSNYSSSIEHVGIYVGNDQFIHSSSAKGSVILSNMTDWYYTTYYYGAVRVPGTELPYDPTPAPSPSPEPSPSPVPSPEPSTTP